MILHRTLFLISFILFTGFFLYISVFQHGSTELRLLRKSNTPAGVQVTTEFSTRSISRNLSLKRPATFERRNEEVGVFTNIYFGVGCFWHIQHEFVGAERSILGRDDLHLTARAGYAGGKNVGSEGRVCYHNLEGIGDYGKLGHAEVVDIKIPENKIKDFAEIYFGLFDPETGERVDPQDKGPEYRSIIGLPGGVDNPLYTSFVTPAANTTGFTLKAGVGDEPDTLGENKLVYVYDSLQFPFHQAEVYMQFRDDFQSPPYGKDYNRLVEAALDDGRIYGQGCPDR